MSKIVFCGGCFWGVQHYFKLVSGVLSTKVGYIGGKTENPTYEQIKKSPNDPTNHAEGVLVNYDSNQTNLTKLLDHFFFIVDPTELNYQGPDHGTQYRNEIYYYNEDEVKLILDYIEKNVKPKYKGKVVTEVKNGNCNKFWDAEEYHQDYLSKNVNGYCHIAADKYNRCRDIDLNKNI